MIAPLCTSLAVPAEPPDTRIVANHDLLSYDSHPDHRENLRGYEPTWNSADDGLATGPYAGAVHEDQVYADRLLHRVFVGGVREHATGTDDTDVGGLTGRDPVPVAQVVGVSALLAKCRPKCWYPLPGR
jgi:hypothetical protein